MVIWPPYPWYLDPLPMIFWFPYPCYVEPLISGISNPLSIVYRTPYPWYYDLPTHCILNPLSMVYWTPNPWYFDPSTHGILTPYLWYLDPLFLAYRSPYPWYFDPPIHDNLTPYSWCIEPPTHGILYIWQRICSVCRNRNPVLSSNMWTAYLSGTPEFIPGFSQVRVPQTLVVCVIFCRLLLVLLSPFLAIVLYVLLLLTTINFPISGTRRGIAKRQNSQLI
jgi:hypothetical protein